ncbi:TetR/AcrR family transcriptional regulator [Curtobacterium sp. B8]|uniref:TetR/AcrR family transcriptional regulator n=1 Tax=Curtobacterium sp. B8 TaxID=95611 RepID=UPI000344E001|nr:TetR/AcrR family transcriptional regulator [Curtobacterium sp. B8]
MARWQPDPRGRLLRAALDLFAEQGYDATTAAQIAERAGLTKATLFRQFPDKREILFQGQAATLETIRRVVRDAPADLTDLAVVDAVLDALTAAHTPEQQDIGAAITALTRAHEALRERYVYKRFVVTETLEVALRGRGVPGPRAALLAETSIRAYWDGFTVWTTAQAGAALGPFVHDAVRAVREAATEVTRL